MLKKNTKMKFLEKVYRHRFIKPRKESLESLNPRILEPRSKGFTLIEIIIVIVILAVVAGISIKFLIDGMRIYTMTVNQKTLFDEGKLALERMCRDIRDASLITWPDALNPNVIRFSRSNATDGDAADEEIVFQRTGTTLEKVKDYPNGPTIAMADNVTVFNVTNVVSEIHILLTLSLTSGESVTLQTTVYPKNLDVDPTNTYKRFFEQWQELRS